MKRGNISSFLKDTALISLLILVSFAVYLNSLSNGFLWDDSKYILDHPFIKDFSNIKHILSVEYLNDPQKMLSLGMFNIARPVWIVSAMIDYKMWGQNPFGHHLTNLMLHGLSVALLFILLILIFKDYSLSFFASLIFALHPIHTETVNVITFRTDMLAFIFMALAFIVFIKAFDSRGCKSILAITVSFIFYIIANLAKDMAVTLPALIGVYLYLFVPKEKIRENKQIIFSYFSLVFLIGIAYLYLRSSHFFYGASGVDLPLGNSNLALRLAVMSLVFAKYLQLLFLPIGLCADYSFKFPQAGFSISVIMAMVLLIAIFISAFIFRKKQKPVSFAVLWFFITVVPVSNIIPMVNIIAERYLYIPSVGFCVFFAYIFLKVSTGVKKASFRAVVNILLISILCFYAAQTYIRNGDWKDNLTIWSKTVEQSPDNFRVRNNLGQAYVANRRFKEAEEEFKKSIELNPNGFIVHAKLASLYQMLGDFAQAKDEYNKALKIQPGQGEAQAMLAMVYANVGNEYLKTGRLDDAMQEYTAALHLNQNFPPVYYNLGNIFLRKNMLEQAQDMYSRAIEIKPDYAEAYSNLGVVYAREEKLDKARTYWQKALSFKSDLKSAQDNLKRLDELRRQSSETQASTEE